MELCSLADDGADCSVPPTSARSSQRSSESSLSVVVPVLLVVVVVVVVARCCWRLILLWVPMAALVWEVVVRVRSRECIPHALD